MCVCVCVWLHLSTSVTVYTKCLPNNSFSFFSFLEQSIFFCCLQFIYYLCPLQHVQHLTTPFSLVLILSLSLTCHIYSLLSFSTFSVLNVTNYNCTLLIIDRESKWSTFSMATLCIYFQFIWFQNDFCPFFTHLTDVGSVRSINRKGRDRQRRRESCHCRICTWLRV